MDPVVPSFACKLHMKTFVPIFKHLHPFSVEVLFEKCGPATSCNDSSLWCFHFLITFPHVLTSCFIILQQKLN